jgi:hypothetical protein
MEQMKAGWDWHSVSEHFRSVANDAERYLNEVRRKVKSNSNYEIIFDEHLAEFYVYNYLHGRTFLETKEMFVAELNKLIEIEFEAPSESFNKERFLQFRKRFLAGLLDSYS